MGVGLFAAMVTAGSAHAQQAVVPTTAVRQVTVWAGAGTALAGDAPGLARRAGPWGKAGVEVGAPDTPWSLRVEAGMASAALRPSDTREVTGDVQTAQFGAGARYALGRAAGRVRPYAAAALTLARPSTRLHVHEIKTTVTSPAFTQTTHENVLGAYSAAGMTVRLAQGAHVFVEARAQALDTPGRATSTFPLLAGLFVPLARPAAADVPVTRVP